MNKFIKFLVVTALTGGEGSIASTGVNDNEDFYTQYPCNCEKEDTNTSCCKTMSALLKKIGLDKNLKQLKQQYEHWHEKSECLTDNVVHIIELDLARTFPKMFKTQESNSLDVTSTSTETSKTQKPNKQEDTFTKTLRKVLKTIAAFNPTWSYLQGFNFIVGTLILHSTESIAWGVFWTLMNNKSIGSFWNAVVFKDDKKTAKILHRHLDNIEDILKKHFPIVNNNFYTNDFYINLANGHYSAHETLFLSFLMCFGLDKIQQGRKNQIKIIENLFDKGIYFVDCLYIACILHAHNHGMIFSLINYKLNKQDCTQIILHAEKIFSKVKCCPCC